jgi:hypothetical protein
MESDGPPPAATHVVGSTSPAHDTEKKGVFARFRKHKEEPEEAGADEGDDGEHKGLGAKLKQKKASRKEKKERREQRKDFKKNPQFDFIEVSGMQAASALFSLLFVFFSFFRRLTLAAGKRAGEH